MTQQWQYPAEIYAEYTPEEEGFCTDPPPQCVSDEECCEHASCSNRIVEATYVTDFPSSSSSLARGRRALRRCCLSACDVGGVPLAAIFSLILSFLSEAYSTPGNAHASTPTTIHTNLHIPIPPSLSSPPNTNTHTHTQTSQIMLPRTHRGRAKLPEPQNRESLCATPGGCTGHELGERERRWDPHDDILR